MQIAREASTTGCRPLMLLLKTFKAEIAVASWHCPCRLLCCVAIIHVWAAHTSLVLLVQAMLVMSDTGALLRFVQRPNTICLDEGSQALRSAGRYSELIALLQGKGLHEAALQLLQALTQTPEELDVAPQGEYLINNLSAGP